MLRHTLCTSTCYLVVLIAFWFAFWLTSSGRLASKLDPEVERTRIRANLASSDWDVHFRDIVLSNLKSTIGLLALGILTAGLLSLFHMAHFGFELGLVAGSLHAVGFEPSFLAAYHLTHGVLEVLAFATAGGIGVESGLFFLRYLRTGKTPHARQIRGMCVVALLSLALMAVAGIVEVFVTPKIALRFLR